MAQLRKRLSPLLIAATMLARNELRQGIPSVSGIEARRAGEESAKRASLALPASIHGHEVERGPSLARQASRGAQQTLDVTGHLLRMRQRFFGAMRQSMTLASAVIALCMRPTSGTRASRVFTRELLRFCSRVA